MGRGKRGRTQRKHFKENRENVWKKPKSENTTTPWEDFATQNPAFEEYYKEQEIVSPEEWDKFLQVLHKALPAAFRINSSGQFFEDIRSQLENEFMRTLEMEVTDSDEVDAIRPLPWYPHNLAWHSNYSRMQLRKNQTLAKFHEFLKQANEIGNITRQEAVSMVPPLFLDVRPEHFILDMCAAPGSKTFQLLEIIHQSSDSGVLPAGMVVANDVDVQRCNLLIHQTKRMCSANLIVTNHEAQHFPGCHVNKSHLSKLQSVEGLRMSQLLFDRVLCDVPCSGDGTLRKAPDIWRKWTAGMGNGVHRLQVEIAMRGVALLNIGGRMVYSTCSMNPVENEAVVAEVLRRCGRSVELLDVSSELPQLVRRPGLKKWKVRDKGLWLASYKDVSKYRRNVIFPSMFPSGRSCEPETTDIDNPQKELSPSSNANDMDGQNGLGTKVENGATVDTEQPEDNVTQNNTVEVEVSCLPLDRCMRIVPHDQNTGAFFIAVLQKLSSLPAFLEKNCSKNGTLNRHSIYTNHQVGKGSSEKVVEETSILEIDPPEDKDHEQSALDEANPDAEYLDKQSEEGALVQDNEAEEAELQEDGKTGHEKRNGGRKRLQNQGKWRGVDPVVIFRDEATINGIREFYGISESFPFHNHLVTRNSDVEHVKRIYYISKSVKDVLELNIQVGQRLKITSVGLKIFERQTNKEGVSSNCLYRISSEGLPLLLPHITKQILCASLVDFRHLLQYRSIKFEDFVDAKFGEAAAKLLLGCCVIVLAEGDQTVSDPIHIKPSTIAIGCWKGRTNISLMVSSADSEELLERLSVRLGSKDTPRQDTNTTNMEIEAKEGTTEVKGRPAPI